MRLAFRAPQQRTDASCLALVRTEAAKSRVLIAARLLGLGQSFRRLQGVRVTPYASIPAAIGNFNGTNDDSSREVSGLLADLAPFGPPRRRAQGSVESAALANVCRARTKFSGLLAPENQFNVGLPDADSAGRSTLA